jgi:hypothetical protein
MLSIIYRNKKIGTLSGHLKIAPKKGEIKRMLSNELQIFKRMLSMRCIIFSVCSAFDKEN